jgi:uncharacterized protein
MRIHIVVKPNSKINWVWVDESGVMHVKIRAQPVEGKANKYLAVFLSEVFNVPKSKIEILKGQTARHKVVEVIADEKHLFQILNTLKKQ